HLKAAHGIDPDEIERIDIGGYRATVEVAGMPEARTPFEGKFSTAFLVASALVHGSIRLDAYTPERLGDGERGTRGRAHGIERRVVGDLPQALMRRVTLAIDPECAAAFPARRSAKVAMTLRDGRRLDRYQPTRKGDPDAPLTDDELDAKFMELAGPVISTSEARRLLAELWTGREGSCDLGVPDSRRHDSPKRVGGRAAAE
ncbi:MAG TPA: hypothetical protein PK264_05400, partial [Hyphomicrobiaceae bacterium]|nr:hypothetical protein [Hyphomicrobiaceae bacterium]